MRVGRFGTLANSPTSIRSAAKGQHLGIEKPAWIRSGVLQTLILWMAQARSPSMHSSMRAISATRRLRLLDDALVYGHGQMMQDAMGLCVRIL